MSCDYETEQALKPKDPIPGRKPRFERPLKTDALRCRAKLLEYGYRWEDIAGLKEKGAIP